MNTRPRFSVLLTVLMIATGLLPLPAAAERAKPFVDPLDVVLALSIEDLALKMGDPSEAGMDRAARLWATAKRVETEGELAKHSVRRVEVLAVWRSALDRWQDLQLEIVYMDAGGGTMWSHMMSRNDAELEKFLSGVAAQLPVEEKEPDPQTAKALDELLKKSLKWMEEVAKGDEFDKPDPKQVASIRQRLKEAHAQLKWAFALSGNAETATKMLRYCREADAAKLIKWGEG
jgi:hypothetical protein